MKDREGRTLPGQRFTELVLESFRFHGRLLAAGDLLAGREGLSSARWQVLGALPDGPRTVPQVARQMGLRRQSVQRTVDLLASAGLLEVTGNPDHRRSPLVGLTPRGRTALERVNRRQAEWANRLAGSLPPARLEAAVEVLRSLRLRLEKDEGLERKR